MKPKTDIPCLVLRGFLSEASFRTPLLGTSEVESLMDMARDADSSPDLVVRRAEMLDEWLLTQCAPMWLLAAGKPVSFDDLGEYKRNRLAHRNAIDDARESLVRRRIKKRLTSRTKFVISIVSELSELFTRPLISTGDDMRYISDRAFIRELGRELMFGGAIAQLAIHESMLTMVLRNEDFQHSRFPHLLERVGHSFGGTMEKSDFELETVVKQMIELKG